MKKRRYLFLFLLLFFSLTLSACKEDSKENSSSVREDKLQETMENLENQKLIKAYKKASLMTSDYEDLKNSQQKLLQEKNSQRKISRNIK